MDTNVLASGIFWSGAPSKLLTLWSNHYFTLIISDHILNEYQYVLTRLSKKIKFIDVDRIIETITVHATLVSTQSLEEQVSRDPDDDKFIEAALAGKAQYIISGDNDLLVLNAYQNINIIKPAAFLELINQ